MEISKIYWFVFYRDMLLIEKEKDACHVPFSENPPTVVPAGSKIHTIGSWNEHECKTYALLSPIEGNTIPNCFMEGLRSSFNMLPFEEYHWAGKASQILNWDANTKFCPRCGELTYQISPIGKKCPICRQEFYPIISPAIIVRITRGDDEVLLVHARNFKRDFYGLVAGFVEAGESLEECVYREVMEETQLKIKNLKYFGSQTWPYPSGIMIGYTAEYESGELKLQDEELSKGGWFKRDALPPIPEKLSLARKLIDDWLEK
jgi:NAD+ diphosphatase